MKTFKIIPILIIFFAIISCEKSEISEGLPPVIVDSTYQDITTDMISWSGYDIMFNFTGSYAQDESCGIFGMHYYHQYKGFAEDSTLYSLKTVIRLDSVGLHHVRFCIFDCKGHQACRFYNITVKP